MHFYSDEDQISIQKTPAEKLALYVYLLRDLFKITFHSIKEAFIFVVACDFETVRILQFL